MKKITTILMLFMLICMGAWAQSYSGIEISFTKPASSETNFMNVTPVVTDADGNAINGITAEVVSNVGGDLVNSTQNSVEALSWTTKAVIGARYNGNNYNSGNLSSYVIKISGLRAGFSFGKAEVDIYSCAQNGGIVNQGSYAVTCGILTGSSNEGITEFVSQTGINPTNGQVEGGLRHTVVTMLGSTSREVGAGEDLYVQINLQKTSGGGLRPLVRTVKLTGAAALVDVTYQVVDANNNVLASQTASVEAGTEITSLPNEMIKDFTTYSYSPATLTATAGQENVFTATATFNFPFIASESYADATWYYMTIRSNKYVQMTDAEPYPTTTANAETEAFQWAFSGNPYTGIKLYNKAAGSGKTLTKDGSNPVMRDGDYSWTILPNSDGFILQETGSANNYVNEVNGKIGFWNDTKGRTDNGSTFRVTKVPTNEEVFAAARELYNTLSEGQQTVQAGYPSTEALAAFAAAIDAAESANDLDALNAAIAAVKSVENTVYTPRTDVYYTLTNANVPNGNRGSMIYHPNYTVEGKDIDFLFHTGSTKQSGALNVALDPNDPNHQWGFIERDGKYYMYNVGKKQFANVTQQGSYQNNNGDKHTWMFSDAPSAVTLDAGEGNWVATPNMRVRATSEVTGKQYAMSISQSFDGPVIAYDAVNDGGIPMFLTIATTTQDDEVTATIEALLDDLTPYREALQAAIDAANALPIGDGLNQYSITNGSDEFNAAIAAAEAEIAKADTETSKAALQDALQALEDAQTALTMTLNIPEAGFYRIKGNTSGNYLAAGNASNGKFNMTDAVDGTTIFYFDGTKLVNYSTGMVNGMSGSSWNWVYGDGAVSTVVFEDGQSNGGYAVKSANAYFYDGETYTDRGQSLGTDAQYRNWYLEEVTELPITLKEVGGKFYATFSAPVDIASIDGADMFDLEVNADNKTASTKAIAGNGLKAGNGVMLIGTSASATAAIGAADETATTSLKPQYASELAAAHNDAGHFFLGTKKNSEGTPVIGFYKLKSEGGKTGGFKAYIEKNAAIGEAKEGFDLMFGEATAIETIDNSQLTIDNSTIYNLQGQRVTKAQKGVYIQNGKKVVLK